MKVVRPNEPRVIRGVECPECGGKIQVSVEAWDPDTGEPQEFTVGCADEDESEEIPDDKKCWECHGGGVVRVGDDEDSEGEEICEDCGGSGRVDGHRYFQSDWQPVVDRVEAWGKKNLRVLESAR